MKRKNNKLELWFWIDVIRYRILIFIFIIIFIIFYSFNSFRGLMKLVFIWGYKGYKYPFCWFQIPFLLVSNTLFVGLDTLFVGSDTLFVDDIYILYIIFTKIHFIDRKELYIIFFKYPFCWFIYSIIFSNTLFVGLKYPCIDKEGIY